MYRLLRDIRETARPLYAPGESAPSVSVFHDAEQNGGARCCAVLGDPGFSLLAGFGPTAEIALLALLQEVRSARAESVYVDAAAHVSQSARALGEELAGRDTAWEPARASAVVAAARRLRQRTG